MEKKVNFLIKGLGELLMNNPASMNESGSGSIRTKKIDPRADAEIRLYKNEAGELYIPSVAFLNSLWQGAAYNKIGKDSARARIQAAIFVKNAETIILDKETLESKTEWEIDSRPVVVKATKGRIIRNRPKISNWACRLILLIDDEYITIDSILPLFNKAGKTIGVGDYRPEKRGPFGRYVVELDTYLLK